MKTFLLLALLVIPWLSRLPFLGGYLGEMFLHNGQYLFMLIAFAGVGYWLSTVDRYLGWFVMLAAFGAWLHPGWISHAAAEAVTFGAGLVYAARFLDQDVARRALIASGVCAVAYGLLTQYGGIDLFKYKMGIANISVFGNSNLFGVYLALLAPIGPLWFALVCLVGILLSQCKLALLAAMVGMMVTFKPWRPWIALAGTTGFAYLVWMNPNAFVGTNFRVEIWLTVASYMNPLAWLIGYGPGMWYDLVPKLELALRHNAFFTNAHNEYVQVIFEFGLVGLGILALWVRDHFKQWKESPQAGSLASLAVTSAGMFPFRVPAIAVVALLLLGFPCSQPTTGRIVT